MKLTVNLDSVKEFVESATFCNFLLNNAEDFSTAAYILQAVLKQIELDKEKENDGN